MAVTNTNDAFMSINGTDVSADWTELKLDHKRPSVKADRGSSDWVQKLSGLDEFSGDITLVYDDSAVPTAVQALFDNANVAVIYGPQGNTSGTPKHEQNFVLTGIGFTQMTDKSNMLVFKCSVESTGAPTSNMLSGDTWSA